MPSLRDIEKTVATLWLNEQARDWLLSDGKTERPECLKDAPQAILDELDRKGISLYGGLISFGHRDVMESIYPYCSKLLGDAWHEAVDDYLLKYPPAHHNFNRLCCNLAEYFRTFGSKHTKRYPFLPDLADYEWIELEKLEQDVAVLTYDHELLSSPEQIATLHPVRNATLTVREYTYNVLDIADSIENKGKPPRKLKAEKTLLAVYRHPETQRCKFVEIGEAAAQVLELARQPITYQSLIPIVVSLTPELSPQEAVSQFLDLVEELQELRVLVGSVK